jgi:hypothetical protein
VHDIRQLDQGSKIGCRTFVRLVIILNKPGTIMNNIKSAICCATCILTTASIVACARKGPVDLSVLKPIVASESGKDNMDIVHKTHENAGIDCYNCHHKWENPDRIRNCTNCHTKDLPQITKDTCVKCHTAK